MFLIVFSSVFRTASKGLAALTGHTASHPAQAPYLAGAAVGSVPGRLPQVGALIVAVMSSSAPGRMAATGPNGLCLWQQPPAPWTEPGGPGEPGQWVGMRLWGRTPRAAGRVLGSGGP